MEFENYFKNIHNKDFLLYIFKTLFDENTLLYINNHKNTIISKIFFENNNLSVNEKKRVYLGLLWFILGFIISVSIKYNFDKKVEKLKINNLYKNKYIIFLTSSYIFYDYIFDSPKINSTIKKTCISYTHYFFEYILNKNSLDKINNYDILYTFLQYTTKNEININDNNDLDKINEKKKILYRKNKFLNNLLEACKENRNNIIIKRIFDLFKIEVKISKIQHSDIDLKEEDILKYTILKSQKSILAIVQIILNNIDCINNKKILFDTYQYGFLSQLLDDLNDIIEDTEEKNKTIFSILICNKKLENYCYRILKYIYYLKDFSNIDRNQKSINIFNYFLNLSILNYVISKNRYLFTNNFLNDIQKNLPFYYDDMKYLRNLKYKFLENNKSNSLHLLFQKYNKFYQKLFNNKEIKINNILNH